MINRTESSIKIQRHIRAGGLIHGGRQRSGWLQTVAMTWMTLSASGRAFLLLTAIVLTPTQDAFAAAEPCPSQKSELDALKAKRDDEKRAWQPGGSGTGSGPTMKPNAPMIASIEAKYRPLIAAKQLAYNQCRIAHGGKPNLSVTYNATSTLTTTSEQASGPFASPLVLGMTFQQWEHKSVIVTSFPDMTATFQIPNTKSKNTTTISSLEETPSGSVDPALGSCSVTVDLRFHHSALGDLGDSTITVTMSTENSGGAPINRNNRSMTLTGTGPFVGGFLGGKTGTFTISGILSALP